jgi:tRNA A37 threonylcarbamoyladenosine modification protein TsaB
MKVQERFMYKIYIDTTERYHNIVRLQKDLTDIDTLSGDIDIVTAIKRLLDKHKLNISNINEFVINKGPGSFTGLKMGATIANVLNWSLKKKDLNQLVYPEYGREPNITLKE